MGEILFLAHRIPFPPDRGDKIRSHHMLKALAEIAPVHVGTFSETNEDDEQTKQLAQVAESFRLVRRRKPLSLAGAEALLLRKPVSLTAFDSSSLRGWVANTLNIRPIDTVFVYSGQMGQYVPPTFKGRLIVDLCDVDSAKFEAYARDGQRPWINAREGRLLSQEEERLARRADRTLLISQNEANLFASRLVNRHEAQISSLGNGIDTAYFDARQTAPHRALRGQGGAHFVFTGQMDYAPNVAAVDFFARDVLPAIQTHHEARFHIVGRAPSDRVLALAKREGVTVWGAVPDVRPFIAAATAVVAPLTIARGVQNKVLEALAMGRPVLLTPQAATGLAAEDGKHFLVREGATGLRDGALELIANPAAAQAMGEAGRAFVTERMSWRSIYDQLADLVGRTGRESNAA